MHQRRTINSVPIFVVKCEKTNESYGRMRFLYGENCTSQREVYKWVERFKRVWESGDDAHSGWPLNTTCVDVKKQNNQRIRDNRTIKTNNTAFEIKISHEKTLCNNGLISNRKHYSDGIRRVLNQWTNYTER
jgi:hypothetical protein